MINRWVRHIGNLLIYGGFFIGLCAACITAFSLELSGVVEKNISYILLIGTSTAALYTAHRLIGLNKLAHVTSSARFNIIRKYRTHIALYCGLWILLSLWLTIPFIHLKFILWILPGGAIGAAYVIPFLSGRRRLRDLGWGKIVMIGWSWGWLTAFIPLWYFGDAPIQMAVVNGLERMLFIIVIAIPFEIRDLQVDQSVGLNTLPARLGRKMTIRLVKIMCPIIVFLSMVVSFHFLNPSYVIAMAFSCLPVVPIVIYSYKINDDYFFSGLTDGLMIFAVVMFSVFHFFL